LELFIWRIFKFNL